MTPDANALDVALAEIQKRVDEAWYGPWDWNTAERGQAFITAGSNGHSPIVEFPNDECAIANGPFIAHARDDVPLLLRVIAKLRKQRDDAHDTHAREGCGGTCRRTFDAELLSILKGEA